MSRSRTRARNRSALTELAPVQKEIRRSAFQVEFQETLKLIWSATSSTDRVEKTQKLIGLIHRIAASDIELWPFENLLPAGDALDKFAAEDRAECQAIFAQAAASHLTGTTSGAVRKRRQRGESPD